MFDLVENSSASSLETTFAIAMAILGLLGTAEIVEDGRFSYQKFTSDAGCRNCGVF